MTRLFSPFFPEENVVEDVVDDTNVKGKRAFSFLFSSKLLLFGGWCGAVEADDDGVVSFVRLERELFLG